MARYLIEIPHEANGVARKQAVEVFFRTGSHFMTHADFGCPDGDHRALLTVEVDSREEALRIVPPMLRRQARIVLLSQFVMTHYGQWLRDHAPVGSREAIPA